MTKLPRKTILMIIICIILPIIALICIIKQNYTLLQNKDFLLYVALTASVLVILLILSFISNKYKQKIHESWQMSTLDLCLFMLMPLITVIAYGASLFPLIEIIKAMPESVDGVLNGLLTITGVIFAVQAIFIVKHVKKIRRIFVMGVIIAELLSLSFVAYRYLIDVSIGNYLVTLYLVASSLFLTLVYTGLIMVLGMFSQGDQT